MSDSSDDDDDFLSRRPKSHQPLFRKDAFDHSSDASNPSSSPHKRTSRPPPPPPPRRAKRAPPRFAGDGQDDDDLTTTTTTKRKATTLFDDLDDLPEEVDVAPAAHRGAGRAASPSAFDRLYAQTTANHADMDPDNVFGTGGLDDDGQAVDGVVQKKRKVRARMDEARLLGSSGFPELVKGALKFRVGPKGSEVKDLKRVLSLYQLWAHQMFPKTNLRDTLHTVEKLCHKRKVQKEVKRYRADWQESLRPISNPADLSGDPQSDAEDNAAAAAAAASTSNEDKGKGKAPAQPGHEDEDEAMDAFFGTQNFDEEEEAMLAELEMEMGQQHQVGSSRGVAGPSGNGSRSATAPQIQLSASVVRRDEEEEGEFGDEFDFDEEAMMAEMEILGSKSAPNSKTAGPPPPSLRRENHDEEDDDMDAMMAEMEAEEESRQAKEKASVSLPPSPPAALVGTTFSASGKDGVDMDSREEEGQEGVLAELKGGAADEAAERDEGGEKELSEAEKDLTAAEEAMLDEL